MSHPDLLKQMREKTKAEWMIEGLESMCKHWDLRWERSDNPDEQFALERCQRDLKEFIQEAKNRKE